MSVKKHPSNYCAKCDKFHDLRHDCTVDKSMLYNSKEFQDKINAEYDKVFAADHAKFSVGKQENVLEKEIWNEAIEAAAKLAEDLYAGITIADEIRKLNK